MPARLSECISLFFFADFVVSSAGQHAIRSEVPPLPTSERPLSSMKRHGATHGSRDRELVSEQAHEVAYHMKTPKVTRQKALEGSEKSGPRP